MLPRIPAGARLEVEAGRGRPRLGEVWVFVSATNDVTAHRFLRRTRRGRFVFFGDNSPSADRPVDARWLVGRVELVDTPAGVRRPTRREALVPLVRVVTRGVVRRVRAVTLRFRDMVGGRRNRGL